MRLAVGVRSADPVFVTVVVHFQIVGHLFTAFAITQHGHVWRMVKVEKFHA
jgi:ribosomal protein S19